MIIRVSSHVGSAVIKFVKRGGNGTVTVFGVLTTSADECGADCKCDTTRNIDFTLQGAKDLRDALSEVLAAINPSDPWGSDG